MDYQTVPEITFELLEMFKHGSFGYTNPPPDLKKVISSYLNNVMYTKVKENNLFFSSYFFGVIFLELFFI